MILVERKANRYFHRKKKKILTVVIKAILAFLLLRQVFQYPQFKGRDV